MRLIKIAACMAAVLACAPAARAQSSSADSTSMLAPGDMVRITVWRKDELSGEFAVGPDGSILHPLYRDIRVAGVPPAQVEARLMEYLLRLETNPRFVVEPLFRVAVGGEVRKPDLYSLAPPTTLAQAVAVAGGPSERGRLDRVRLLRAGAEQVLDLTRADAGGGNITVRSGDQILVPRRMSVFRDYIAPASGLAATAVSLIALILQQTRKE